MKTHTQLIVYLLLLISLVLTLQSCGFQLRQNITLSANLQPVFVKSDTVTQTFALLRQRLAEQGIQLADKASQARLLIELSKEYQDERTISVAVFNAEEEIDSSNLREIELIHQLRVQFSKPDGTILVKPKTLHLTRELIHDERQILAKADEEKMLRNDMQQEILGHILRRLSRVQDVAEPSTPKIEHPAPDSSSNGKDSDS